MFMVDSKTLLHTELTDEEAERLRTIAEGIVLNGKIPDMDDPLVKVWFAIYSGNSPHQDFMSMSLVFPQRALISVLRHAAGK